MTDSHRRWLQDTADRRRMTQVQQIQQMSDSARRQREENQRLLTYRWQSRQGTGWESILALVLFVVLVGGVSGILGDAPGAAGGVSTSQVSGAPSGAVKRVVASALHIRQAPGIEQPIIKTVYRGEQVTLLNDPPKNIGGASWIHIRSGNASGWVNQKYLK